MIGLFIAITLFTVLGGGLVVLAVRRENSYVETGPKSITDLSGQRFSIGPPKPTKSSDQGFYLLPPGERNAIEQKEWATEWDSEFKELDANGHKTFYGLTVEEEENYLKILAELEYALVRVRYVKDVRHREYDYEPETHTMRNGMGSTVYTTSMWDQKVLEDVRFKDLENPDEVPTEYRMCGCTGCYKRLIDYLRDYATIYFEKATPKGRDRYSPKNRKALPGYSAVKYQDPKDKGVPYGPKTQKAIEGIHHVVHPYSRMGQSDGGLIVNGSIRANQISMLTADKIMARSITADMITVGPMKGMV